jgi:hypothetical protein
MKGFNSPLTSKEQLKDYTKEQLIDAYFELSQNHKKLIDIIFNMTAKEFEDMKIFYNIINNLDWGENK